MGVLKKRTWHYIMNPDKFCIQCTICGNNEIQWSEYEKHIWCPKCEKDVFIEDCNSGIFSGPIPVEMASMFGMCFDRWDMEKREYLEFKETSPGEWDFVVNQEITDKVRNKI